MKKIKLTKGKFAIVDDEDYIFLSRFSWQYILSRDGTESASTNFKLANGRWVRIPMNRFLYKPKIQHKVIFINKNPLDNRKENIKLVTTSEFNGTACKMYLNLARQGKVRRNPTSKYKGVSKVNDSRYILKNWRATIQFRGKLLTKLFASEKEAGKWYNEKARELFGKTAYQNKI